MASDRIEEVVAYLADEFGWHEGVEEACRQSLGRTVVSGDRLEFICDSPASANWRLKRDRWDQGGRLRMAWYGSADNGDALATAEVRSQELQRIWGDA